VIAGSAPPLRVTTWRTFTNASVPLRPCFTVTSSMVDVRAMRSPTQSGSWNVSWLPAHMRRGSGTGGRKPPRSAWPSTPRVDCRCTGRKYSQCHNGGNGVPSAGRSPGWSSVAESAANGVAVTTSSSLSLRPIHARSAASSRGRSGVSTIAQV
jgi:hypothetical protein